MKPAFTTCFQTQDTCEFNKYVHVILEVLLWSEMVPPMVFIMLFCSKVVFLHSVWELINNLGRYSQGHRMCIRSSSIRQLSEN